jgi:hypothetical protein
MLLHASVQTRPPSFTPCAHITHGGSTHGGSAGFRQNDPLSAYSAPHQQIARRVRITGYTEAGVSQLAATSNWRYLFGTRLPDVLGALVAKESDEHAA